MEPIFIGTDTTNNKKLYFDATDVGTHVHGIGSTRSGKSKFLEHLAREFIKNRQGLCVIDPHGTLYDALLSWLAFVQPNREIVLFNPSYSDRIVPFNPFLRTDESETPDVFVSRRVRATLRAWGQENVNETPTITRFLRCLYRLMVDGDYSVEIAKYLFQWEDKAIRENVIDLLPESVTKKELLEVLAHTRLKDFSSEVLGAKNRMFRFMDSIQLRRIIGLPTSLDIEEIIEKGQILLVNLQPSSNIDIDDSKLLGTLLLNQIWEVSRRRKEKSGRLPSPFHVIVDECQNFLTPDLPEVLPQSAKCGLHYFLFHHYLVQMLNENKDLYHAVMQTCRTKLVFGLSAREDAQIMTEHIFPGQVDLKKVKLLIEQTKFWPVYGRDQVISHTVGSNTNQADASSIHETSYDGELSLNVGTTTSQNAGTGTNESTSITDVPIHRMEPFKEVSSVQYYSLQEVLWQMSDQLMQQYQRHFFLRRLGHQTIGAVVPNVTSRRVTNGVMTQYLDSLLSQYPTAQEVDVSLEKINQEIINLPPYMVQEIIGEDEFSA